MGWLLTYANPTNWYDPNATENFSELTISSKNSVDDKSTTSHAYTFGAEYEGRALGGFGRIGGTSLRMSGSTLTPMKSASSARSQR